MQTAKYMFVELDSHQSAKDWRIKFFPKQLGTKKNVNTGHEVYGIVNIQNFSAKVGN